MLPLLQVSTSEEAATIALLARFAHRSVMTADNVAVREPQPPDLALWYDRCVHNTGRQAMVRRTINLPASVDEMIREMADEDESFSAAVTRLIQAGAKALGGGQRPRYVGAGDGPRDLGRKADEYLRRFVASR